MKSEEFIGRLGGYSRDALPNWLNLIAFDTNTDGSPFVKAREMVEVKKSPMATDSGIPYLQRTSVKIKYEKSIVF